MSGWWIACICLVGPTGLLLTAVVLMRLWIAGGRHLEARAMRRLVREVRR